MTEASFAMQVRHER